MKAEQAFYTRKMGPGLGVYAASVSKSDRDFWKNCSNIGSRFEVEPGSETAEFIYYSSEFGRYVGVGVSPSSYTGNAGRNKLTHIWVPDEASDDPSQIYLKYEFDRFFDENQAYESREYAPVLTRNDFGDILKKYAFSQEKLAEFIEKLLPLVFGERNFLAMIFSEEKYDRKNLPEIARELTWLASTLAPVLKENRKEYCKKLSYSVFSEENIFVTNLGYVTRNKNYSHYFEMAKEPEKDISAACMMLAGKAMESLDAYEDFVKELYTCRTEEKLNGKNLKIMYFFWQLQNENHTFLRKELPIRWQYLLEKAKTNSHYKDLVYTASCRIKDLTDEDREILADKLFKQDADRFTNPEEFKEFFAAYENSLLKIADGKSKKAFRDILYVQNPDARKNLYTALWDNESIRSCMIRDMESCSNGTEFLENLKFYEIFRDKEEFRSRMQKQALDKEYYFQLTEKEREEVSQILAGLENESEIFSWKHLLREKIEQFFCMDQPYAAFMKGEVGKIEPEYIPVYFSFFLRNRRQESDEGKIAQLQKTGRIYLEVYKDRVNAEEREAFQNLDRTWSLQNFEYTLKQQPLEKLPEYSFKGFEPELQLYKKEFFTKWYEVLMDRLQEELTKEGKTDAERLQILKALIPGASRDRFADTKMQKNYEQKVWEYCGDSLAERIYCSDQLGIRKYSIWSWIGLYDTDQYEGVLKHLQCMEEERNIREKDKIETIEKTSLTENDSTDLELQNAELNRKSYLIWKQIHMANRYYATSLPEEVTFSGTGRFLEFLQYLQNEIVEGIEEVLKKGKTINDKVSSTYCLNYMNLQFMAEKVWEKENNENPYTPAKRCEDYKVLKEEHPLFYKELMKLTENRVLTGMLEKEEKQRMEELKLYEALVCRERITDENAELVGELEGTVKAVFGEETEPVKILVEEFNAYMSKRSKKLEKHGIEIEDIENKFRKMISEQEETKRMIEELQEKWKKQEDEKNRLESQIKKEKGKYYAEEEQIRRIEGRRSKFGNRPGDFSNKQNGIEGKSEETTKKYTVSRPIQQPKFKLTANAQDYDY